MNGEKNTFYSGLSQELLDISSYVLTTCGPLARDPSIANKVGWRRQSNPELAIEADLAYPLESNRLNLRIVTATMLVEDSDVGLSLTVSRKFIKGELRDDDPTGLYILDMFRKHYQKAGCLSALKPASTIA